MNDLHRALAQRYLGTRLEDWLTAAAIAVAVTALLSVARRFAVARTRRWAERTATRVDDILVSLIDSLRFLFFLAVGLWLASEYVHLSTRVQKVFRTGVSLLTLVQFGISVQAAVRTIAYGWTKADVDGEAKTVASATAFLVSLAIWVVLVLTGFSILGFEVSALIAGLGVGGVAAALAVQNVLGDLFASLSIYFDRPFNLGDFIAVGNDVGTVEKIGLRTTRVRSLSGEQLVFANGDLTKSRLRNFKRMLERRVEFAFGVEYGTPLEKLREIPVMLKSIVEAQPKTRFDRAHFKEYADFALNFEVVFFVLSPDYNEYMDIRQGVNLELFREFAEREIRFALPTQKLVLVPERRLARETQVEQTPSDQ